MNLVALRTVNGAVKVATQRSLQQRATAVGGRSPHQLQAVAQRI